MKKQISQLPLLAIFAFLVFSCHDKYVLNSNINIDEAAWAYNDTLDFKIAVADTTQRYNLYVHFEHADSFPNQNIYLKLHTRFPDGKRLSKIRSFDLFDIEGKPVGDCSGNTCSAQFLLQDRLYFNQMGDYTLTLEQHTRNNPLSGMKSVGIRMEEIEKKKN